MSKRTCEAGSGFDPSERTVEQEFQQAMFGSLLAPDRAVGRFPEVNTPVLKPTRALEREVYDRFKNPDQQADL